MLLALHVSQSLKNDACARSGGSCRRAEPTFKVLLIKKIIHITEETQLPFVTTEGQGIARSQIRLRESFESIPTTGERGSVKDCAEVITRSGEIKIDQNAMTNPLGRNRTPVNAPQEDDDLRSNIRLRASMFDPKAAFPDNADPQ